MIDNIMDEIKLTKGMLNELVRTAYNEGRVDQLFDSCVRDFNKFRHTQTYENIKALGIVDIDDEK